MSASDAPASLFVTVADGRVIAVPLAVEAKGPAAIEAFLAAETAPAVEAAEPEAVEAPEPAPRRKRASAE